MILNLSSPRANAPPHCTLKLKEHQCALLKQCKTIEDAGSPFVVLNDKPGTGKSFVVLAHLMWEKINNNNNNKINLLVIPPSLFEQWQQYLDTFFEKGFFKHKSFIQYDDICTLFYEPNSILGHDLLITTSMYYPSITQALTAKNVAIHRLIVDEIDSIEFMIPPTRASVDKLKTNDTELNQALDRKFKVLPAKYTWFVSASFHPDKIGMYRDIIQEKGLSWNMVTLQCEPGFLDACLQIPPPILHHYTCKEPLLASLLANATPEEATKYHAMDFSPFLDAPSLYRHKVKQYLDNLNVLERAPRETNKPQQIAIFKQQFQDTLKAYQSMVNGGDSYCAHCLATESLLTMTCCKHVYCQTCLIQFPRRMCPFCRHPSMCTPVVPPPIVQNTSYFFPTQLSHIQNQSKMDTVVHIVDLLPEPKSILIFSDYTGAFKQIKQKLIDHGYTCDTLDGGNLTDIGRQIMSFQKQYTQIMCVDSHINSAGLNFEQVSDVILLHDVQNKLQCIGRAQRMGRSSPLRIHELNYT